MKIFRHSHESHKLEKENTIEIIKKRRAVFPWQYNAIPISDEQVETILEAANWAPTHKHTEPWRFKVIRGEKLQEMGDFIADCYKAKAKKFSERKYNKTRNKFLKSSCVILVCMQRDLKERIPEWEEIAATAMAVQNMWLAATELKLGAYWSSSHLRTEVSNVVDFEEGERCLGFFYLGNFDGDLMKGKRRPWRDKVTWL